MLCLFDMKIQILYFKPQNTGMMEAVSFLVPFLVNTEFVIQPDLTKCFSEVIELQFCFII